MRFPCAPLLRAPFLRVPREIKAPEGAANRRCVRLRRGGFLMADCTTHSGNLAMRG